MIDYSTPHIILHTHTECGIPLSGLLVLHKKCFEYPSTHIDALFTILGVNCDGFQFLRILYQNRNTISITTHNHGYNL